MIKKKNCPHNLNYYTTYNKCNKNKEEIKIEPKAKYHGKTLHGVLIAIDEVKGTLVVKKHLLKRDFPFFSDVTDVTTNKATAFKSLRFNC